MKQPLLHKHIVLGVTGGIAAYKSADLVRRLREVGANVRVVMTKAAKEFITPLTLQAVSGNPVHDDLFDVTAEAAMGHIELARWADVVLVAPATADFLARLLNGEANDLLTTICLAAKAPLMVAPAMNQGMWKSTFTQDNIQALHAKGVHMVGPTEGSQACGDVGLGRMSEPLDIVDQVCRIFQTGQLSGKTVLITAGPTHEAIDPIRYITNASSGKMGYALAEAAHEAGANVILISGPVHIKKPARVKTIDVVSAEDMRHAVMTHVLDCDLFFSVAAVSDYRCQAIATQKIAKHDAQMTLHLERNPDIVSEVAHLPNRPIVVGFAAETNHLLENAKAKLAKKKLDMIVANQVGQGIGIGSDDNAATVIWGQQQKEFATMSKAKLARELITLVAKQFLS